MFLSSTLNVFSRKIIPSIDVGDVASHDEFGVRKDEKFINVLQEIGRIIGFLNTV